MLRIVDLQAKGDRVVLEAEADASGRVGVSMSGATATTFHQEPPVWLRDS